MTCKSRLGALALAFGLTLAGAARAAPDWTGVWVLADSFMDTQDGSSLASPGRPGGRQDLGNPKPAEAPPVFTPAYQARSREKIAAMAKAEAAGKYLDVAAADCRPLGMPRFWFGPYAFEFLVHPRQINIYQEAWEQTRRIYLDGRKHPSLDDAEPLYQGHSVGRWEGKTLVVDTTNVNTATKIGVFDEHSEQLHIVERFTQTAPDFLTVTMTLDDPQALVKPWTATYRLHRKPKMEIADYVCSENNRNPVGADGGTGTLLKSN